MSKTHYTRQELIEICDRAIVGEELWMDRDSAHSQRKVGALRALLMAGCTYRIVTNDPVLKPDENTIWVEVSYSGFRTFDEGADKEREAFYLPTQKRLDERGGKDWY